MVIDIRRQRRLLTPAERTMLEATNTLVAGFREQLAEERLRHEMTRGDLLLAHHRIRELEAELGLVEEAMAPEGPARSGEMKAAEKVEEQDA